MEHQSFQEKLDGENGWWKLQQPQNLIRPMKQKQGAQWTPTTPPAPYTPTPASEEELKESPEETKRSFRVALRVCWPFPILDLQLPEIMEVHFRKKKKK